MNKGMGKVYAVKLFFALTFIAALIVAAIFLYFKRKGKLSGK